MLNKNRSGKLARLKYLAALPLCAGMLCTSTLVFSKDYGLIDLTPKKARTSAHIIQETPKQDTVKKTPPPPPRKAAASPAITKALIKFPPPAITVVKFPPPRLKKTNTIPPPKITVVKFPPPAISQVNQQPPPPVPYDPVYKDLIIHMSKFTRYPAAALDNKVNGHVILSLVINKDHQVTDIKVERGIGSGCDEEAIRALNIFKGTIDKAPGTYTMAVTFMLQNSDNTKFYAPKPLAENVINKPNFIGQVVIAGYIK